MLSPRGDGCQTGANRCQPQCQASMSSPRWAGREGSVVEMVDLGIVRRATNRWSSQGHNVGLVGENLLEETFTAASETGNAVWQTMLARSLYPPSHPSGVSNER